MNGLDQTFLVDREQESFKNSELSDQFFFVCQSKICQVSKHREDNKFKHLIFYIAFSGRIEQMRNEHKVLFISNIHMHKSRMFLVTLSLYCNLQKLVG